MECRRQINSRAGCARIDSNDSLGGTTWSCENIVQARFLDGDFLELEAAGGLG